MTPDTVNHLIDAIPMLVSLIVAVFAHRSAHASTVDTLGHVSTALTEVSSTLADAHAQMTGAASKPPDGFKPATKADGSVIPNCFVPLAILLASLVALPAFATDDPVPPTVISSLRPGQVTAPCGPYQRLAWNSTSASTAKLMQCVSNAWTEFSTGSVSSLPNHSVVLGTGSASLSSVGPCTNGQLVVGQTGSDPLCRTMSGDATFSAAGALTLGTVQPTQGGTGQASPTAHTIPIANGASAFALVGPLTNGQILVGATGANPTAQTVSGDATLAASGVLTLAATQNNVTTLSPTGTLTASPTSNLVLSPGGAVQILPTGALTIDALIGSQNSALAWDWNYCDTETGANNAIVCNMNHGNGANDGTRVCVKLAHTLQAGANTYTNNTVTKAIKSHFNASNDIGTAYAATGIWCGQYDGTQWLDLSQ